MWLKDDEEKSRGKKRQKYEGKYEIFSAIEQQNTTAANVLPEPTEVRLYANET